MSPKKAAMAVGHSILVTAYHMLEREVPHAELGEDYFHRQRSGDEAYAKRLIRQLELRYSRARPDKMEMSVEYVGGRIKVFGVARYLIERLLDQLENQEGQAGISTPRGDRG
jgi:hypothetical protein